LAWPRSEDLELCDTEERKMNLSTWIDILLAAVGLGVALAPIGGETWHRNEPRLSHRLTIRGWMAVILLFSSVVLSGVKAVNSAEREKASNSQLSSLNQRFEAYSRSTEPLFTQLLSLVDDLKSRAIVIDGSSQQLEKQIADLSVSVESYKNEALVLQRSLAQANKERGIEPVLTSRPHNTAGANEDDYNDLSKPIMEVK
jgi:hypothetical protein